MRTYIVTIRAAGDDLVRDEVRFGIEDACDHLPFSLDIVSVDLEEE